MVILLDGDARGDADRLDRQLRPFLTGGLVRVGLPHGRDPGGYERAELWEIIRQQAAAQGVTLPEVAMTS